MPPYSFDGIRVDKACHGVHELSCMADAPAIHHTTVTTVFVREDHPLRVAMPVHERRQCSLRSIIDRSETAGTVSCHTASDPLTFEWHCLIPFRGAGKEVWPHGNHDGPEDAVQPLSRLLIASQCSCQIRPRHAASDTEALLCAPPLRIGEVTAALHGIRALCEYLQAMRALISLPPAAIFAVTVRAGNTTEATENGLCRHNRGKKACTGLVLPFLPTHFWSTT